MEWEKKFTRAIGSKRSVLLHTIFFIVMLALPFFGVELDTVLLFLTTLVSLEAIYLAIFIQMSVNENTASLEEVEEDIEEIQEDMDEIQADVEEIQEDVDEIQADVDEIQADVDEIQEDVDEISTDIGEIGDEIEDIQGDIHADTESEKEVSDLENIHSMLAKLLEEVDRLKKQK